MNTNCVKTALVVLLSTSALAHAGSLGTAPACQEGTFASYTAPTGGGFVCNIGLIDVFNFQLYTIGANGEQTAANSDLLNTITINPIWNSDTGQATLTFGGFTQFSVASDQTRAWGIRYTIDPPPVVGEESMSLDPPFGNILGTQSYCMDSFFVDGLSCGRGDGGFTTFGIGEPANLVFDPPLAILDTFTTIRLNPNLDTASGFDGIVFGVQTVAAAPEPSAWFLAASGLALLGRLRRRR